MSVGEFDYLASVWRLAESGPFDPDSQPRWSPGTLGLRRLVGLDAYERLLVSGGTAPGSAARIVATMRAHGADPVLVAAGAGLRRGRVRAMWDVRVAAADVDARPLVTAVVGPDHVSDVASVASPLRLLYSHPYVVAVRVQHTAPFKHAVPRQQRPGWARRLNLPMHIAHDLTHYAHIALAVGRVGATLVTAAQGKAEAESAMARLARPLLDDLQRHGHRKRQPPPPDDYFFVNNRRQGSPGS